MISKSIIIIYSYDENKDINVLVGKSKEYKDYMFIGGGKKKNESINMCASREIYEETKKIIGPINYLDNFISDNIFKCRPIKIVREINRRNKIIKVKLKVYIYFLRISYVKNINELFQKEGEYNDICYNEMSDIQYIKIDNIDRMREDFFQEDIKILDIIKKESDLIKLININQKKQNETLSVNI